MSAIGDSINVELPTARFTAVNGKDETSGGAPMASMTASAPTRRGSEERSNGQPRVSPPGQEKLTITTTTQKDEWAQPTNGERPSERQPYPPSNTYVDDISHKRKRSDSHSASTEQQTSSSTSYHGHSLPSGKPTPTTASAESDVGREEPIQAPQPDSRSSYIPQAPYGQFNEGRESQGDTWYTSRDERSYGTQHAQPHLHPEDEQHLGEVIQRETQRLDAQNEYGRTISGEETKPAGPYSQAFMREESSPMSADPKKRKRNFSNRTKTGCMTCRRRKKKCDETKPECNNCLRGGFVCSGYQARGQWPKTEQKQPPIPLQSKNEYDSPIQYSQRMQSPYNTQQPTPPRRDLPGYRGQQLRVDPPHGRPIGMDDDQASVTMTSGSVTSPDNSRLSAISYQTQTPTPISASASAYPDRLPKNDFQRVGPLHDHTRHESKAGEIGTPQSTLPHILHPQSSPHANLQMVAQTAQLAIQNPNANRPPTAKEHMLAGRQYFPFDKELVLERERCNGACWRFNSSTNPNNGVSPEERARLFRDILQPRENVMSPSMASPVTPVGRVGDNVVVEAPFHCDYGYNITIGKEVFIGKNCTILDTCEVKIGDRCIIGPNVNIYTAKLPVDAKRRLGSKGPRQGQPVTIENDCWIGGNVTILPGRTIGKNSTVGAGSVVTADVEPNRVVGGNPCRVIRRVGYEEGC